MPSLITVPHPYHPFHTLETDFGPFLGSKPKDPPDPQNLEICRIKPS